MPLLRVATAVASLFAAAIYINAADSTLEVAGLEQPVEILVDRWGVPHIYAKSQEDLFFAQGFNAARDRLFQIDLWRRRGLGRLAEVFGHAYVEQDRAARLFLYRGDMYREWLAYGRDANRIATAFAAGINAYVEHVQRHPGQLPYEFKQFGYEPATWLPEDVVRIRSHGLTRNLNSEVARARVACKARLEDDAIRVGLQPPWQAEIPDGLEPCLPQDVLKVFRLATQAARIPRDADVSEGSNNWVIAPRRSATGRAILANDPHRAYSAPSLRYIAHLSAPGLDAGHVAVPVQHRIHPRAQLGSVYRRDRSLGCAYPQPRLRGRIGQHRLDGGRTRADPAQLGWLIAGARRRLLRVGGLLGSGSAPVGVQPKGRVVRHRESDEPACRLSLSRSQARVRMGQRFPVRANPGGAGEQPQDFPGSARRTWR